MGKNVNKTKVNQQKMANKIKRQKYKATEIARGLRE